MMSCGKLSDVITGSSLLVLTLVATSGKAMRRLGLADQMGEIYGTDKLGLLGYVVIAWFALLAYKTFSLKCPAQMSNPKLEQGLIAAGLALGAYSLYVDMHEDA